MLPLSEDTILWVVGLVLVAASALYTSTQGLQRPRVYAVLIILALLWPWPIAFVAGLHHYTIMAAGIVSLAGLAIIVTGTLYGLAARRLTGRQYRFLLIMVPAILSIGSVLERQRVPDAVCAHQADFVIGDLALTIPIEMGVRSVTADGKPPAKWEGSYSNWQGAKPSVRQFCLASRYGHDAIHISHLWFPVSWFRKQHEASCDADPVPSNLGAYCHAMRHTRLTIVQLFEDNNRNPGPSLGHFNQQRVHAALAQGKISGFYCGEQLDAAKSRYCDIWLPVNSRLLAIMSARVSSVTGDKDILFHADTALRAVITALAMPEPTIADLALGSR